MTPSLRDAAKAVIACFDGPAYENDKKNHGCLERLESALSEPEPAVPKVERVTLVTPTYRESDGMLTVDRYRKQGYEIIAERPLSQKSRAEELAERLEKAVKHYDANEAGCNTCVLFREAAKLLRTLERTDPVPEGPLRELKA